MTCLVDVFPSLFMGRIIRAIGAMAVAMIGALLLIVSSVVAVLDPMSIFTIKMSLIALGLGWNMTYVDGSYLVAAYAPARYAISIQAQAVNDVSVGVMAMLGEFLPGAILINFG